MSKKLIPDTNLLIYLVRFKILDELDKYQLFFVSQIFDELDKLSSKGTFKDKTATKVAIEFLKLKKLDIRKQQGKTDDAIIALAKKLEASIGTMDKALARKAKKQGINIIRIRQKKYLQ